MTEGHGLDEFLAKLAAIPNAVHVTAAGGATPTPATSTPSVDFERAVLAVVDRRHRRQTIAQN